ncbi:MAG TPA: glycosyltransferase [Polyangiales bacterium]|jgi:GT2 family glycosyltransferase|nr:glycosyltransferase [Polyangiales bacterium]
MSSSDLARVGVVAIGRNEGERLRRCFASLPRGLGGVVYVDSGSSDGSVPLARERGYEVVELDMSRPFTAARARNAGFERLMERWPEIELVQFLDGDCAVVDGWIETAAVALDHDPNVAAVWGRRRELAADSSPYNRMCDIEWGQLPPGDTDVFGGDVMLRANVVRALGGYDPRIIAGEDPELAVRVRKAGHRIVRLDAEMTRHDAALTELRQWWLRSKRSGFAYAQVSALHGAAPQRFWVKDTRRALFWGLVVPGLVPVLMLPTAGASSLLLGAYPLRFLRVMQAARRQGLGIEDARAWAFHCIGASFPQALGILQYHVQRVRGTVPTLIEYKGPQT